MIVIVYRGFCKKWSSIISFNYYLDIKYLNKDGAYEKFSKQYKSIEFNSYREIIQCLKKYYKCKFIKEGSSETRKIFELHNK